MKHILIEKLDYFSLQTHIVHFLFFVFTFHYCKIANARMNKVIIIIIILRPFQLE